MFQTEDWGDEEESQPQLSALSWAVARGETNNHSKENKSQEKPEKAKKQKKERKSLKETTGKALKKVSKSVEVEMDRLVNSPSATVGLLATEDDDDDEVFPAKKKKPRQNLSTKLKDSAEKVGEAGKKLGRSVSDSVLREPGHLLRLGEKFQSAESFLRFIGLPGKTKKSKKRKLSDEEIEEKDDTPSTAGDEKENSEDPQCEPVPPPRKKKKAGLDTSKLRSVLEAEDEKVMSSVSTVHKTLADEARAKLTASRFRFLNEKLYTQESKYEIFSRLSNTFTVLLLLFR